MADTETKGNVGAGLRLALTTFTVVPLRPGRVDRAAARVAMIAAPLVGLLLGAVAAAALYGARHLWRSDLVAAVLVVVVLALLTGGLHLDGLADTADGLGAPRDRERRLAIMRGSEIGPFGAATLVLVLLGQVAALTYAADVGLGTVAVLTAVTTARLAVSLACLRGVPPARAHGLGAMVAGTVDQSWAVSLLLLASAVLCSIAAVHDSGWVDAGRVLWSVAAGLVAGALITVLAVRRVGGITGDVLGAIVEVSTALSLLAITVRV